MIEWNEYRVKDIARQMGSGTTPSSKVERYYDSDDYHWINSGDFNDGDVYGGKQKISELAVTESSALRFYMPNTVLVAMYGASIGKVGMLKVKATVNQACCAIVPNTKKVLPYFLFYLFINSKDGLISKSFGGTQPNVSQGIIANMIFRVPSLPVQQKIVDYLDEKTSAIDAQVELLEKKKDAYTRLKKAMINRAVTHGLDENVKLKDSGVEWIGMIPEHWVSLHLKNFVTINNGSDYKHIEAEEGIPVIGSGGIFAHATEKMYDGEVLLLGRKGTIDRPMYYKGAFWAVDTMFYAIPMKNVSAKYLYYCATQFPFNKISTATALPSMTQTDLYQLPVVMPPYEEQQSIAAYLDEKCAKIDAAIANIDKQTDALKRLKRSLINEVITGQRAV